MNPKIKNFVQGRKNIFTLLEQNLTNSDKVVWMHCASLGEFEQGRPVWEAFRKNHPEYKGVISFFSPSGYLIRKDYDQTDIVIYLPYDTTRDVRRFLDLLHPDIVIWVKYEFWPVLLTEMKRRNIPVFLISGIFREEQFFFKFPYAVFIQPLQAFIHFFVQNQESARLLHNLGLDNVVVSGDTRFDRVAELIERRDKFPFIEDWRRDKTVLIMGSTWPADERLLLKYIHQKAEDNEIFILAPHVVGEAHLKEIENRLNLPYERFSQVFKSGIIPEKIKVLIIDGIGKLTSIYAYADVAYIGGGFGSGIHNILEPATYGLPVIFGPNNKKFVEAVELKKRGGAFEINNFEELSTVLKTLMHQQEKRKTAGTVSARYVQENKGATEMIVKTLELFVN